MMITVIILRKDLRYSLILKIITLISLFITLTFIIMNLFVDNIFCISASGEYSKSPFYFLIYGNFNLWEARKTSVFRGNFEDAMF